MSVGGVTSNLYQSYLTGASNALQQVNQDLQKLCSSVQSGVPSSFAALLPSTSAGSNSTSTAAGATTGQSNVVIGNSQITSDLQSLESALKAGNIGNARTAYSQLVTDLKGIHGVSGGGHHKHHGGGMPVNVTNSATDSNSTTASNGASTSSTASTPSAGSNVSVSSVLSTFLAQLTGSTFK